MKGKLVIIVNGKPRAGKDTFALLNNGTIKDFETNIRVFYFNIVLKLLKKIDKREDI